MNIREEATLKILAKLIFEFLRLIFRSKQDCHWIDRAERGHE